MGSRVSALEFMGKIFELGCCQRFEFRGEPGIHMGVTELQYFYPPARKLQTTRLVRNPDFFPAQVLNPDLAEGA
jgi:hypothetical protein